MPTPPPNPSGSRRQLHLDGVEFPSSGLHPAQLDGLCSQVAPLLDSSQPLPTSPLPPGPPAPRPVWRDDHGTRYVLVDEEGIPKARRFATGSTANPSSGTEPPRGFLPIQSNLWKTPRPVPRSPAPPPRSAPDSPASPPNPAPPKPPTPPPNDPGPFSSPWMGTASAAAGGMLGGLFAPSPGKSPLQSILQGGVASAVSSALMGAFGNLFSGLLQAKDSDPLAQQLAARFTLPLATQLPSLIEKFAPDPPAPGEPVCRGRLTPGPTVFVEGIPIGLVDAQVLDTVPSLYVPPGAPKLRAGGIPVAVASGLVRPLTPPGPDHPATPMIHAATVTWAAPTPPVFRRKDGKVLEKGDPDLPLDTAPMCGNIPPDLLDALQSGAISETDIRQFMQDVGMPAGWANGFDLSSPEGQVGFFSQFGQAHFWDPALGYSASLNEYFMPQGWIGGTLNQGLLALQRLGTWSGAFDLGSPQWPGAGTGSMWWAPDRIGNSSISRLFVQHDAEYGIHSFRIAEGNAWLNGMRQNPHLVGLVYSTAAVAATSINGVFDPTVGYGRL